ncbi:hypothetical protein [Tichowtungia aerotolerans]|uniref:Uncharacterized protein n=1 Tax=Tichowtungia aerotolerans TaxID=2697043 RepID=A0A6P1M7L7_9BACT|nr:hypothetical protein [Tichowtungia aerotolerans]QHI68168.1 hypothetical protein GT409_01455 [Tichowtungia aerotolerans]
MKFGCFLALLLLPITLVIQTERNRRRRAAIPPDQLKEMDEEVKYGPYAPNLKCIYCKTKGKVRRKREDYYVNNGPAKNSTEGVKYLFSLMGAGRYGAAGATKCEERCFAHCMNCGNHWEMLVKDQETS